MPNIELYYFKSKHTDTEPQVVSEQNNNIFELKKLSLKQSELVESLNKELKKFEVEKKHSSHTLLTFNDLLAETELIQGLLSREKEEKRKDLLG